MSLCVGMGIDLWKDSRSNDVSASALIGSLWSTNLASIVAGRSSESNPTMWKSASSPEYNRSLKSISKELFRLLLVFVVKPVANSETPKSDNCKLATQSIRRSSDSFSDSSVNVPGIVSYPMKYSFPS
ncbi:hypothetical protein WICPIJ_008632 [Wickerhamomyces pijperi]|uniref:Uncharacterized protein n=1 Tax=Wickerhamomyces pijperi TaxID=599730 RepID=A0A9P8PVU9_WICPI|nr:hypothetical protein WICPIJ_008632 [Wickerhamomyces pijperi]